MKNRIVKVAIPTDEFFWKLNTGDCYEVLKEYFRNGEFHMKLKSIATGKLCEYPSVFFKGE